MNPNTHRRWLLYRKHYGQSLLRIGRISEAEEILTQAYRGLSDTFGASDRRAKEVAGYLVELYEARGRPEKAAEYRALLNPD